MLVVTFVANDAVEAHDRAWRLDDSRPAAVAAQAEAERRLRRVVRRSMVLQIVNQRVDQVTERDASGATAVARPPPRSRMPTPPP